MLRRNGPGPRPTTLPRAGLAAVTVASGLLVLAPAAGAATDQADGDGYVAVIEVSGLLDEVLVDFVETQIDRGRGRRAPSPSSCSSTAPARSSSDARLDELVEPHRDADGAGGRVGRALGQPGHRRGRRPAGRGPRSSAWRAGAASRSPRSLLGDGTLDGEAAVGDKVSAGDAVDLGLVDNAAPTIGVFVYGRAARVRGPPGRRDARSSTGERQPVTQTRFGQLPLDGQLLHTVASPPVAYLLFVIGLALIVFELYTAGVGVAGLVGAGCLVLGCYGLAVAAHQPLGGRPAAVRHVRLRRRRADRACPGCGAGSPPRRWPSGPCCSTTGSPCRGSPCSWPSAGSPSP